MLNRTIPALLLLGGLAACDASDDAHTGEAYAFPCGGEQVEHVEAIERHLASDAAAEAGVDTTDEVPCEVMCALETHGSDEFESLIRCEVSFTETVTASYGQQAPGSPGWKDIVGEVTCVVEEPRPCD